jgi:hypothetical protein
MSWSVNVNSGLNRKEIVEIALRCSLFAFRRLQPRLSEARLPNACAEAVS